MALLLVAYQLVVFGLYVGTLLDCVPMSRPLLRHDPMECLHHLGLKSRTSTLIENFHASTMLLHKQLLHVYLLTAYVCILKEVNLPPISIVEFFIHLFTIFLVKSM